MARRRFVCVNPFREKHMRKKSGPLVESKTRTSHMRGGAGRGTAGRGGLAGRGGAERGGARWWGEPGLGETGAGWSLAPRARPLVLDAQNTEGSRPGRFFGSTNQGKLD